MPSKMYAKEDFDARVSYSGPRFIYRFAAPPNSTSAEPFPQLLPDAESFELTIREDFASSLPLGPACGGEASLSLACRAFVVTLKNVGAHTVHLSRIACQEPVVNFEMKEPNSSSGWMSISQVSHPHCTPWIYENLRLRPGETTEYRTRLVSKNRPVEFFAPIAPRSYTIHARWLLWGCTENPEGNDCLVPLQALKPNTWGGPPTGQVEIQTPVEVVSKEIEVNSPSLPDMGPPQTRIRDIPRPRAASSRDEKAFRCLVRHGPRNQH